METRLAQPHEETRERNAARLAATIGRVRTTGYPVLLESGEITRRASFPYWASQSDYAQRDGFGLLYQ
eukprot:2505953-Lingulodinium_polyedra.AAC.1